ncbi:hypothetical protein [Sabulibacter ruber]|uniref:hypothetical protein n=1 Tax=Sabulibacter ruber TaxID=2811901 RepID=UPI001A973BD9|nr:hypothetical protein [Sabulibacter ruber]
MVVTLSLIAVSLDYYFKNIEINKSISSSYTFNTYVVGMFDCNGEKNIPTYISSINLFISAGLLFLISRVTRASAAPRLHKQWSFLGFLFLFLALDELLMLHEVMGLPFIVVLKILNGGNDIPLVRFTGFIPYILAAGFSFFFFVNWFFSLPKPIMYGFIASGLLVVIGAVGIELLGEYLRGIFGKYSYPYKVITTFEESLEMLGIMYFIKTLLVYLKLHQKSLNLKFDFGTNGTQGTSSAEISSLSEKRDQQPTSLRSSVANKQVV